MFPTLLAAAGDPDIKEKLLKGYTVGGKTYKVHLDGYNMLPYLTGEAKESPRNAIIYFSDDGEVMAVRVGDWKFNLAIQRATKMMAVGGTIGEAEGAADIQPSPRPLRTRRCQLEHLLGLDGRSHPASLPHAGGGGRRRSQGFVQFPPRQKPASFNLDAVLAQVSNHGGHS